MVLRSFIFNFFSSFPLSPDRPGSRDEIPCWWCCVVTARDFPLIRNCLFFSFLFVGVACANCNIFPPISRTGMRVRTFPPWHMTCCGTGYSPDHRRNLRHKTSLRQRNENPIYLINGLFYRASVDVPCWVRNVVVVTGSLRGARGSKFHLNRSPYGAAADRSVRRRRGYHKPRIFS